MRFDQARNGEGIAGCLEAYLISRPQRGSERGPPGRDPRMSRDLPVLEDRHLTKIAMNVKTYRTQILSSRHVAGGRRANDNYGYVLAAQPGQSQGRPTTTPSSKLIIEGSACPTYVLPGTPDPVGTTVVTRAPRHPAPLSWPYNLN